MAYKSCFGDFAKFICISVYCVSALSLHIESTDSMTTDSMITTTGNILRHHATIVRTTPVLLADLYLKRVGSYFLMVLDAKQQTCFPKHIKIVLLLQKQLSVLCMCISVLSCIKLQAIYDIL